MRPCSAGRPTPRPGPATLLALLLAGPATAAAGSAQGSLAVSVEVVESCRVASGSGSGSELVACGSALSAPARAGTPVRPVTARGGTAAARITVEPTGSGPGFLTVVY